MPPNRLFLAAGLGNRSYFAERIVAGRPNFQITGMVTLQITKECPSSEAATSG